MQYTSVVVHINSHLSEAWKKENILQYGSTIIEAPIMCYVHHVLYLYVSVHNMFYYDRNRHTKR